MVFVYVIWNLKINACTLYVQLVWIWHMENGIKSKALFSTGCTLNTYHWVYWGQIYILHYIYTRSVSCCYRLFAQWNLNIYSKIVWNDDLKSYYLAVLVLSTSLCMCKILKLFFVFLGEFLRLLDLSWLFNIFVYLYIILM